MSATSTQIRAVAGPLQLDPLSRAGLYGFLLNGFVLTLITSLMIAFDAIAKAGSMTVHAWVSLGAAVFVLVHAVIEARSRAAFSVTRWLVLFCCLGELVTTAVRTGQFAADQVLLGIFAAWGGLNLLGARVLASNSWRVRGWGPGGRVMVMLAGWHFEIILLGGGLIAAAFS